MWAHRRSWHRKYLDYRALAEALRVDLTGSRRSANEFDGNFAHESFLQKQDAELQWIRNAMRAVSLQLAIHPCGNFNEGFPFVYANWVGDDHPTSGTGQMSYYRRRLHKLKHTIRVSERIDGILLFGGLMLALAFAVDVALRTQQLYLLPSTFRADMLWALALVPVYAAIFEIYLNEKSDRALVRQYKYMYSLFSFAANELRAAKNPNANWKYSVPWAAPVWRNTHSGSWRTETKGSRECAGKRRELNDPASKGDRSSESLSGYL